MDMFVMQGPTRLSGTVRINGAKNAVLPLMAAALLSRGKSVIENVPRLRDVQTMIQLLEILGARVTFEKDVLTIDTARLRRLEAPYELVRTMRASIYVLGPLVAAHRRARVSMPGGCAWGPRPIDLHLMALERLGAKLTLDRGYINASAQRSGPCACAVASARRTSPGLRASGSPPSPESSAAISTPCL